MDCFNDFCIACDKESHNGGAYCSQACRMADLERASAMDAASPSSTKSRTYSGSSSNHQQSPKSTGPNTRPTSSYFSSLSSYNNSADPVPRSLTPSSSRSSLSSTMSTLSNYSREALTERAQAELQSYYSSFDKVKQSKRRMYFGNVSLKARCLHDLMQTQPASICVLCRLGRNGMFQRSIMDEYFVHIALYCTAEITQDGWIKASQTSHEEEEHAFIERIRF
nr:hypothetical protein CFP56_67004 [Quercus suber]